MRLRTLIGIGGVLAALVGCGAGARTVAPAPRFSAPRAVPSEPVTKVLVVIEENHSLDQMRTGMPYTFALAERFGYAVDYHAMAHPSLPNYLAIAGGSTFGVTNDNTPAVYPVAASSVFSDALARGRTAAVYADGMPSNCDTSNGGDNYLVRHNPWAYFVNERAACDRFDVPGTALRVDVERGHLPNIGLVIPNSCNDAHECGLDTADAWFANLMSEVFAGPDWRAGRLAVVLTADEDDKHHNNTVLTVVAHPSQRHHLVATRLNHYSLFGLLEDVIKGPHRGQAATAPSMTAAFGLPVGSPTVRR